jgi:hypothetical protein
VPLAGAPITRLLLNPVLTYMVGAVIDTANIARRLLQRPTVTTRSMRGPRIAAPVSDP